MLGRCMYRPEQLFRMHCPMMQNEGLGPEHVDIMCKHMEEVLSDLGASEETVEVSETGDCSLLTQCWFVEGHNSMEVRVW